MPEDFPDKISPMVVKEVRQGLRSRSFILSFLLLHTALVLWAAGFLSDSGSSKSAADGIFWTILGVGLAIVVFRAQSAVRGERDGKTLELLQLTRLTAWNIVAGKWCSLMVEALVVITGVLPYFALRYYFGTLRILQDSAVVGSLLVLCGLIAAFMVMLSCLGKLIGGIARVASYLVLILFGIQALAFFAMGRAGRAGFSGEPGQLALFLLLALPYTMLFLGVAAASVAPASENIATRQRLWGLALFVPAGIAAFTMNEQTWGPLLACALPGLALLALECLLRRSNTSLPVYAEGFGRRAWRRALAPLFAPSHGAGILFFLMLWGAFAAGILTAKSQGADYVAVAGYASVTNTLLLPVALAIVMRRFLKIHSYPARYWISVAVLTLPVAMLGTLCMGSFADTARAIMAFLPLGILVTLDSRGGDDAWPALIAGVHTALWALVIVPFLVRDFRAVRRMMRGERVELPSA